MYGRQIMGTSDDSVLRAVLHDLIHGFELPQIEFVMRNTDAWLYGWGILKIMFNDCIFTCIISRCFLITSYPLA